MRAKSVIPPTIAVMEKSSDKKIWNESFIFWREKRGALKINLEKESELFFW